MNYQETLEYLFNQFPEYQKLGKVAYKGDLNNTIALDKYFNQPHTHFRTIHVAGTNGKGSTAHTIASILQSAGYKTGLYTSPHLKDFRERIRVNGEMISEEEVVNFAQMHKEILQKIKPSFFEMTVAMAFDYFKRQQVDVAVIEVGLGGRLDSTNIINPDLSIITNIGIDHTMFLGDTLSEIAQEKAGIIKHKTPVVIGERHSETQDVFIKKAAKENADITFAQDILNIDKSELTDHATQQFDISGEIDLKNLEYSLLGLYQRQNILTVLAAVLELRKSGYTISDDNIRAGLANVQTATGLMGRWQQIGQNPTTIVDTGHNEHGIRQVAQQLESYKCDRLHIVWGMVSDKNPELILPLLPKRAIFYFTQASIKRALPVEELAERAAKLGIIGKTFANIPQAIAAAKANAGVNDLIFIGGSTFTVAEAI